MSKRLLACITLMAALMMAPDASACRCQPQAMQHYFERADRVLLAVLESAEDDGSDLRLRFSLEVPPYKGDAPESWTYLTSNNSAGCGLVAEIGRTYLLFAQDTPSQSGESMVHSCNGSRPLDAQNIAAASFIDTPGSEILQRLDHLRAAGELPGHLLGLLELDEAQNELALRASLDGALLDPPPSLADLQTRELGYEQPAAMVFGRGADAWQLRLHDGSPAWIADTVGRFHAYDGLPVRRLAYLSSAWDGQLWPLPGAGHAYVVSAEPPRETPIDVLESARIGGSLWFRVRTLSQDPCGGDESVRRSHQGWVYAHGKQHQPTVWYYSRGC